MSGKLDQYAMETYEVSSCVRGHHVFKNIWRPTIGEQLVCKREVSNAQDTYAVAVMRGGTVVGHVPRKISAACALFLGRKGSIRCTISGSRCFSADLPQGGLEVPCILKFQGDPKDVAKVRKLVMPLSTIALQTQSPSKKRKIDCGVVEVGDDPDDTTSKPWLTLNGIDLSEADRDIILSGECLTDKHMDFAQALLKKQFGSIAGLKSTLVLPKLQQNSPYHGSEVLQIIHCRGNHWVVVSTLQCPGKVQVFDSLFSFIDGETKSMLTQLFGEESSIEMGDGPKQKGGRDCGVYAIATSTALAHGRQPHFTQGQARAHLVKCFENFCLTVFS